MDIEVVTKYAFLLERIHWFLIFFAMLSEMSSNLSFPSYNMILGFWGVYCSYVKNGRAVFGLILFTILSIVLDIIFCFLNGVAETYSDQFAFVFFVVGTFVKVASVYAASHFFAAIGGALSLDSSNNGVSGSVYEALAASSDTSAGGGGYYPMHNNTSAGASESSASHPHFVNISHKEGNNSSNMVTSMGHSDGGAGGGRRGGYILQNSDITLRGLGESGAF